MAIKGKTLLRTGPVVCAVDKFYMIVVPVNFNVLMGVRVNGIEYYNHSNGIKRSDTPVQRFIVPMEELDRAKEYTVFYRKVLLRQAYSCAKGPLVTKTYKFKPIEKSDNINVFLISDCHGIKKESIAAGKFFNNDLDLLILNGDISSSCMTINEAMLPYEIAYDITHGEIPCVITRGNHDLRGKYSEKLEELMPAFNNKMYYQVCLGSLWLLVLDCGEDKNDQNKEYDGTAAFHYMRVEETEFLKKLASSDDPYYNDKNVKHKIVVSHIPFVYKDHDPFDIENELYQEWTDILNESIHPTLCLAGHLHQNAFWTEQSPENYRKINCPVVVTGIPHHGRNANIDCAGITLHNNSIDVTFTDKEHTVKRSEHNA